MRDVLNKAKEKYFQYPGTYALCHYIIKDNKVKKKIVNYILIFFVCSIDLSKLFW